MLVEVVASLLRGAGVGPGAAREAEGGTAATRFCVLVELEEMGAMEETEVMGATEATAMSVSNDTFRR